MGLEISEVQSEETAEIEQFFSQSSINDFKEFFPVEMAKFASEHFGKREYFYAAKNKGDVLGAMHFSIQGGVGQLAAIQVKKGLKASLNETIRHRLFQKFIKVCSDEECHLVLMWIPYQYRDIINIYLRQGFEKTLTARNLWYRNDYILLTKEL